MVHPQLVLLDPLVQGVDVHTAVPQVGQGLHNKAVAGGGTQGIHDVDLPVGELLPGDEGGAGGGVIGAGQAGGQADMQDVLAALQNGGEQIQILGDVHLRGAGLGAVGHGLIEDGEGDRLAQIVGVGLAVQGEVEAGILNITGGKMLVSQVGCGAAGQCVRCHESSSVTMKSAALSGCTQYTTLCGKSQPTAGERYSTKKPGAGSHG